MIKTYSGLFKIERANILIFTGPIATNLYVDAMAVTYITQAIDTSKMLLQYQIREG